MKKRWACLILCSFLVYAKPSLTGITDSVLDGNNLTITGTGFGADGPTIYKWDDFEGDTHTLGSTIGAGPGNIAWGPNSASEECFPNVASNGKTNSGKYIEVASFC